MHSPVCTRTPFFAIGAPAPADSDALAPTNPPAQNWDSDGFQRALETICDKTELFLKSLLASLFFRPL